jgi:Protein of unknown function (DUF3309)
VVLQPPIRVGAEMAGLWRIWELFGPFGCLFPALIEGAETHPMLSTILIIILILALLGALPRWGYSRSWGYGPSGLVGTILIILLILALLGRV